MSSCSNSFWIDTDFIVHLKTEKQGLPWLSSGKTSPSNTGFWFRFDPWSKRKDPTCFVAKNKPKYKTKQNIVINSIKTLKMVYIKKKLKKNLKNQQSRKVYHGEL